MKVFNLHLRHRGHTVVEKIYGGDMGNSAATLIEVIAPKMEAALAEAVGRLPADREWWVEITEIVKVPGKAYVRPGAMKTEFRLADDGRKRGLLE